MGKMPGIALMLVQAKINSMKVAKRTLTSGRFGSRGQALKTRIRTALGPEPLGL